MSDAPPDLRRVPWTTLRLRAFREDHPNGEISTRIIGEDPLTIVAEVFDESRRMLARGTARHTRNDFAVEDVETSAVSRALKFAGYVIDDGDLIPREVLEFGPPAPAPWPARFIKGGMVTEIAKQVTGGDLERATELAALAWDTFNLAGLESLPEPEARDKIEAALELARQEVTEDLEAIDAAEHVGAAEPATIVHLEGDDGEPTQPHPVVVVWNTTGEMRASLKARGITSRAAWTEVHALAERLGVTSPAGSLDSIFNHESPELVAAFAAWVHNHDELER